MNNEGIHMDVETQAELERIEGRLELALQKTIDSAIRAGIKDIKDSIAELFNKDIEHINEHLGRHDKYHDEHYKDIKRLWKTIDELRAYIPEEVDKKQQSIIEALNDIKDRIIEIETSRDTAEKIEEKTDRKKEIAWGAIAAASSVAALVGGGIGFLISMI